MRGGVSQTEKAPFPVFIALLEDDGELPAVHGWLSEDRSSGEYSMLSSSPGTLIASRDQAGTRPLWLSRNREWVSSDSRLFPGEEADLLPPGSQLDLRTLEATRDVEAPSEFDGSFDDAASRLAGLIEKSVKERVAGVRKVAVAFSGGLDSSILLYCAMKHAETIGVTVHAPSSMDGMKAASAADLLGIELHRQTVKGVELGRELSKLSLPFEASLMDKALWYIYSEAARISAQQGAAIMLLGQLADELFGGYMKYTKSLVEDGEQRVKLMMSEDVSMCGERGFLRDEAACSRWIEPRFPFADAQVLRFGLEIPVGMKIRKGVRKAILREAARVLGLPEELVKAPKKAAQYSSGVQKLVAG